MVFVTVIVLADAGPDATSIPRPQITQAANHSLMARLRPMSITPVVDARSKIVGKR